MVSTNVNVQTRDLRNNATMVRIEKGEEHRRPVSFRTQFHLRFPISEFGQQGLFGAIFEGAPQWNLVFLETFLLFLVPEMRQLQSRGV